MPKSTVATFQNGLFYSKKLFKVTDEEKSDSDTSPNERSNKNWQLESINFTFVSYRFLTAFSLINFSVKI